MSGATAPFTGPVLSVEHLSVLAKQRRIIDDISLEFPPRSLTAFVGPSGCGKTTFIRTLNRMTELTPGLEVEGSVLYLGQDIYGPKINPVLVRRRIGMVFQRPTVFPMSIFENAAFGLRIIHEPDDEVDKAVTEALTRAGLWDEVKGDLDRSALSLS
jgi:phosphate transport system ATP-binding protein